ncbi:hypothetical protein GCM10009872_16660 [Actinopolymorpha rutila]
MPLAGRTEDDVLQGMNQLWRRNIKKPTREAEDPDRIRLYLARHKGHYTLREDPTRTRASIFHRVTEPHR